MNPQPRSPSLSRRSFLALAASAALGVSLRAQGKKRRIPVGILLYAIESSLNKDFEGTLAAVGHAGFDGVEFTHYFGWTPARAKEVRAILDRNGLLCYSTHNEAEAFTEDGLKRAVELNRILGSTTICCVRGLAGPPGRGGRPEGPMAFEKMGFDSWPKIADVLRKAAETLRPLGMSCAFHNHTVEFAETDGAKPIDTVAGAKDVVFHLDVNSCRSAGSVPVAFVRQYPGRLNSLLLTEGPRTAGRRPPLLGRGTTPWRKLFAAAETVGGVQYYLLAQAGGGLPPLQAIGEELGQYRLIHG